MSLTFIGGFLDAYTYKLLGGRFASMQSGNLIYFSLHIMDGAFKASLSYLVPVLFFFLGSFFCVVVRRFTQQRNLRWHLTATLIELVGFSLLGILSNKLDHSFLIAAIAFLAAIQAESFKKLRGMTYGTIMSTGNLKNVGIFFATSLFERERKVFEKARNSFFAILFFILGAISAVIASQMFNTFALLVVCAPLCFILLLLFLEHLEHKKILFKRNNFKNRK